MRHARSWRRRLVARDARVVDSAASSDRRRSATPIRPGGPQGRVAQFVVECELSHLAFDDPLVLPGNPGKSHLHMFFGNRAVDSDPDYNDRVLAADTSCDQRRDTASYWAPALLDRRGQGCRAAAASRPTTDPGSGVDPADVVAYPEGIMIIGGDSTSTDVAVDRRRRVVVWHRRRSRARHRRSAPTGRRCGCIVTFPDCWDGNRLTTFGSSAHVRYSDGRCPDSHPVAMPQLTIGIDYPPVDPDGLSLASGGIETAHADFWNVWDQDKLEGEVAVHQPRSGVRNHGVATSSADGCGVSVDCVMLAMSSDCAELAASTGDGPSLDYVDARESSDCVRTRCADQRS